MGPVVAQAKAKATQLHTENVALRAKLRVATESRERAAKAEDQLKKVNKALWAKLRLVTEKVAKQSQQRTCEDCVPKAPTFGLVAEGKKRWCAGCAKRHMPGSVDVAKRKAADEKAAPKEQKAANTKAAPKKQKAADKKVAPKKK
jgi:hypothetical protein